jgi:hypothetical protein
MVDSLEVEQVAAGDPRSVAERLEAGAVPLIIRGGAASWPAVERWNPAYLVGLLGAIELPFKLSGNNAHPDFRAQGLGRLFARGRAALPDFFRSITTGPVEERARCLFTGDERFLLRRRAGRASVDPELSPLLGDVSTPPFFAEERLHTVWAWFSGVGVRTWLHYDNNGCHNLNAQIAGSKRCVLFPPEELARLHVFPLGGDNPAHNCSRIDVEHPSADVAADLAAARAWHAQLAPGDLLFIPAWWFHTFLHTGEFNANVNFWWKPERPSWNVVAARQALVDAAQAAALDTKDPHIARALGALDAAVQQRSAG